MMLDEPFLDNVTKQANALGQAFKESQAEIKRLQFVHSDLVEKWLKGRAELDDIVLEGNSLVSQLCLLEEQRNKQKKNISSLENDIHKATDEYKALKQELIDETLDYENMKREILDYNFKMEHHAKAFTEVENRTPWKKQADQFEKDIEDLQVKKRELLRKRTEMLTNSDGRSITKEHLMLQVSDLKQQIEEKQDAYETKKHQLESVQKKRQGMEMTSMVQKKKNSALLIRMKRKLEEQKEKHSIVVAQRDYLLKMIDTTKRKLERFTET